MVENVRGLLRESFTKYFAYITLQLKYPEVYPNPTRGGRIICRGFERHETEGRVRACTTISCLGH